MKGHWLLLLVVVCAIAGAAGCTKRSIVIRPPPPFAEAEVKSVRVAIHQLEDDIRMHRVSESSTTNNMMSTAQLQAVSEELLVEDTGMSEPQIRVNAASRTLFTKDTGRLMQQLLDKYNPQTTKREVATDAERVEENLFLEALMETAVMKKLETLLTQKGLLQGKLRDILKLIWFTPYPRAGRHLSSSGFEHVFVGEVKVSGLENWLSFLEEDDGDLDYKKTIKTLDLGDKGEIITMRLRDIKTVGTVFEGTTPELEVALYTLCFLARPNAQCPVQLAGNKFNIQTWTQSYKGKTVVGSAYPSL